MAIIQNAMSTAADQGNPVQAMQNANNPTVNADGSPTIATGSGTAAGGSANYTPAQLGDPTKLNVAPNQTVQGQMASMIDPNSPYYQAWQTAGAQNAASRGLSNSSIGSSAILDSVMRNATPIAQSDAATFGKAAAYNTDEKNQFTAANATAQNAAAQYNAGQTNQVGIAQLGANTQRYATDTQQLINTARNENAVLLQNSSAAQQAYNTFAATLGTIDTTSTMDGPAKNQAIQNAQLAYQNQIASIKQSSPGAAGTLDPGGNPNTPNARASSNTQANFDGAAYLRNNPDVAKDPYYASNPYQHYVDHGQSEGRSFTPSSGAAAAVKSVGGVNVSGLLTFGAPAPAAAPATAAAAATPYDWR